MMAKFYGSVKGNRGEVHRLGSAASGLSVTAASWKGAVMVRLTENTATGEIQASVVLAPWRGHGVNRLLYLGPVDRA